MAHRNALLSAVEPDGFNYVWRSKQDLPERMGERCRILMRADMKRSVSFESHFEFEDGAQIVAPRGSAVRVTR